MQTETSAPSAKRERCWRRQLTLGVLFLAVVIGVCEWIKWPFLRKPLQSQLHAMLGRDVQIGENFGVRSTAPPRRVLPQRDFDLPSLAAMDADVSVDLDEFDLGTSVLDNFSPFRTHLIFDDQSMRLKDIVAHAADRELRGRIVLDAKPERPLWAAELHWSDIQLARFLKAADATEQTPNDANKGKRPKNPPNGYLRGAFGGQLTRLASHGRQGETCPQHDL
jgi:uncharacterized protein involved in outer membrane biogenesis